MKFIHTLAAMMSICVASCCGCNRPKVSEPPPAPINSPIPTIEGLGTKIDEQAANIRTDATVIQETGGKLGENLKVLQADVQDPTKQTLVTDSIVMANKVQDKAEHITTVTQQIDKDTDTLKDVAVTIRDLEVRAAKLAEAEQKAKEEALKRLYAFISTFWVIGFIVVVGGTVVGFFVNKTMGFTISMIGATMIAFAAASTFYMKEIAQFGAFLLVGMTVFGMVILVRSIVNAHKNSTAVREIVEMIDILKETMTDGEKARIFGPDGVASKVQSDLTKEVVSKIRGNEAKPPQS